MRRPLQIGIVGAGPAGLAAALFLHRDGHRVTLMERFDAPRPVGSGLMLQPTGLAVLHELGLLPAILARSQRVDRLAGHDAATGRLVLDVRYSAVRGGRFGLGVHRAALFDVLHDAVRAAGIPIVTGREIADLDTGSSAISTVSTRAVRDGPFDLLVDASGARSALLRHAARGPGRSRPLPWGAIWGTIPWPGDTFDDHALQQRYVAARIMIGVLPLGDAFADGGRHAALFWSLKPDEMEALRLRGYQAWSEEVARLWPELAVSLDRLGSFDAMALARYGHHTLSIPAGRSIAFIGDAAHSTSPQLGQGANMALLDAASLAKALRASDDVNSALDAYVRARRAHVRLYQALSTVFTPFYQSDSAALAFVRDRVVASVARVPPVPLLLAQLVSGMLLSPLAAAGIAEPIWPNVTMMPQGNR